MRNLDQLWPDLEAAHAAKDAERFQRRLDASSLHDLYVGINAADGRRMLILRTDEVPSLPSSATEESQGLRLRVAPAADGRAEIQLMLNDPQNSDLFDVLIGDITATVEIAGSEREGVNNLLARLSQWQALFRRLSPSGLTREQQIGLWGELWLLRELLVPNVGMGAAIDAWQGPLGANQDVQLPALSIEVKSTTANALSTVRIANERQLESTVPTLVLATILLQSHPTDGLSLQGMVRQSHEAASVAGSGQPFGQRLAALGYREQDEDRYAQPCYEVREVSYFTVGDGFPRLIPDDLPSGVTKVSYDLALDACRAFSLDTEALVRLLRSTDA